MAANSVFSNSVKLPFISSLSHSSCLRFFNSCSLLPSNVDGSNVAGADSTTGSGATSEIGSSTVGSSALTSSFASAFLFFLRLLSGLGASLFTTWLMIISAGVALIVPVSSTGSVSSGFSDSSMGDASSFTSSCAAFPIIAYRARSCKSGRSFVRILTSSIAFSCSA